MPLDTYMAGRQFENLLRKVYPPKSVQAHKSLLENALTMEQGHTFAKHLGSTEKQLKAAQKKLIEILGKLQTKSPYSAATDYFNDLSNETCRCNSAECLSSVVDNALTKASAVDKSDQW